MDTSHYNEEHNEVATLQSAVQNSPENPLHYMKLLDTLKTNDSSEISQYFISLNHSVSWKQVK